METGYQKRETMPERLNLQWIKGHETCIIIMITLTSLLLYFIISTPSITETAKQLCNHTMSNLNRCIINQNNIPNWQVNIT